MNINGIYDILVRELTGNNKWHIGPRGNKNSKFKVYAKDNHNKIHHIFDFDGQEELDYTIWTKDTILLFEAKSLQRNTGLDIGWHKIAFTASRFKKFQKYRIIPIYLLTWGDLIHLFVFPDFMFHEDGILINDKKEFSPIRVFKVNR